MDVTPAAAGARQGSPDAPLPEVVWHDLECGGYRADLDCWRGLADELISPAGAEAILDVGAGTGRVALDLARSGHRVCAVDLRPALLEALAERAGADAVETVCADARTLDLRRSDFALCLLPMQTLQLLGGGAQREELFKRARAHLRPGGVLACAIVTAIETFDRAAGDVPPAPEQARVAGRRFVSRAIAVRVSPQRIVIERERAILPADPDPDADVDPHPDREAADAAADAGAAADPGAHARSQPELDVIELDRVKVAELEREAHRSGLTPLGTREIPPTADHVGSTVVMFGA